MNRRTFAVYMTSGFTISILLLSIYFLFNKPERTNPPVLNEGKRVLVFRDVKYSGEKKGVVDWEIRAKVARKYVDKPMVEMEEIDGIYRPKPDTLVTFTGSKGEMDTEAEKGTVQDVDVVYKGEYRLKSRYMDFDFKQSVASTGAPVDLKGKKMTLIGVGLNADTKEQVVKVMKDVSGTIETDKGRFKFSSDTFTYLLKENTYIFDGKVVVKGEEFNLLCEKVYIFSQGDAIEKIDAKGKVRLLSKGAIAKSERAVYYFKDDKVVLSEEPKIVKDKMEMQGEKVVYDLATGRFSVEGPKMRIER